MRKALIAILALGVVAAACGDDTPLATASTATTSTVATTDGSTETTDPATETTATTAPVTTEPAAPEPNSLAALSEAPVDDPLFDTGWHELVWVDAANTYLHSPRSMTDSGDQDLLSIVAWDPAPVLTGVAADQVLVNAWTGFPSMDVPPSATVLYSPGAEGFEATVVIGSADVEAALLETTDYAAAVPDGLALADFVPTVFDLSASMVTGMVTVIDLDAAQTAYEGEIQCDFSATPLVCITLTDDGVLRPGDEGEAVEELQNDLKTLGYLTGNVDGKYGPGTEGAVSAFQRDYWLGRDGKVGPVTGELIKDLTSGKSNLLLISKDGTSKVAFGVASADSYATLIGVLGTPDSTTGWYQDGCDGHDWFKAHWDGFAAVFTDRDGTRQFDGWEVNDLGDLPSIIRIAGGIKPSTTWSYLDANGSDFYDDYLGERWRNTTWVYTDGRFTGPVSDPPAGDAGILSFGTGTGGFESC